MPRPKRPEVAITRRHGFLPLALFDHLVSATSERAAVGACAESLINYGSVPAQ